MSRRDFVEVKFVGHGPFIGGLEAIYKVKRIQKLEKFMQSFGKAVGFPWENLRFMMVPEMVWYDTILQELGITDSEIEIDVFHGQPQDFSHLLWSGLYSDTVIKVEGQTIKCHMPLLTQFSQVFSEMATAESIIHITDLSAKTVRLLLVWIYCVGVQLHIMDVAKRLLEAAEKFKILDLKRRCELELIQKLTWSTCADLLAFAHKHKAVSLLRKSKRFIQRNSPGIAAFVSSELGSVSSSAHMPLMALFRSPSMSARDVHRMKKRQWCCDPLRNY